MTSENKYYTDDGKFVGDMSKISLSEDLASPITIVGKDEKTGDECNLYPVDKHFIFKDNKQFTIFKYDRPNNGKTIVVTRPLSNILKKNSPPKHNHPLLKTLFASLVFSFMVTGHSDSLQFWNILDSIKPKKKKKTISVKTVEKVKEYDKKSGKMVTRRKVKYEDYEIEIMDNYIILKGHVQSGKTHAMIRNACLCML